MIHTEVQKFIPNPLTYFIQYGQYCPNQVAENNCKTLQSYPIKEKQGNQTSDMVIQLNIIAFVFRTEVYICQLSKAVDDTFPL